MILKSFLVINKMQSIRIDDFASFYLEKSKVRIQLGDLERETLRYAEYSKDEHLERFYKDRIIKIFDTKDDCSNITLNFDLTLLIVLLGIKRRYFILDKVNNLIFVPLGNKQKNIVDYGVTEMKHLNKIQNHNFCRCISENGKKYIACTDTETKKVKSMQELIFGRKARKGYKIDHINSNGLDNRSCNLRELTNSENAANLKMKDKGFRGIYPKK